MSSKLIHEQDKNGLYPKILKIEDWPINRLKDNKEVFIEKLARNSIEMVRKKLNNDPQKLHEEIAKILYKERGRIKQEPWKADPKDDWEFWARVNEALVQSSLKQNTALEDSTDEDIFSTVMNRYAHEIPGEFSPKIYNFASKVLPFGFNAFLNTEGSGRFFTTEMKLDERIKVFGNIKQIRELALKGTVVLLPTHFSNLDSIVIGWALHMLGLPAFLYGAGLNLFNSRAFGFFMNGLGAYKVDRRKKNLFYLETLKMYSRMVLQYGCHSLFFPGGTRARSGQIETKLKLGLLSSVVDAQRLNFIHGNRPNDLFPEKTLNKKIFIVPLVLNYHFVLEASSLIEQHLKRQGRERYYIGKSQPFPSTLKFSQFVWKFLRTESDIVLSFGEPMDIFGNKIDEQGRSISQKGNEVDISKYFVSKGQLSEDYQRDSEYTHMLSKKVIKQFYQKNIVLGSHLMAYVAFEMLYRKQRRLDLFGLLRLPQEDRRIPYEQFATAVERARNTLREKASKGELKLEEDMQLDIDTLITKSIKNLGIYHSKDPLIKTKDNCISSEDMNLLYYYHNRLKGYGLDAGF